MMILLITMSWMFSLIFILLKHPLSLGLIILIQTLIISLITGIMNLDFWFSYILFLIMIGGMLVLFIYMTSIASNEKFKFSNKILFISLPILTVSIFIKLDKYFLAIKTYNYDQNSQALMNLTNLSMNKLMNNPSYMIMILLMIYLLITLIAIVKITQSKMGPLRPYQ